MLERNIHYQFTAPEAAFIVYWCKHATLDTDSIMIPIDLEYYRESLNGIEQQLQVVSLYEKGRLMLYYWRIAVRQFA